MLKLLDLTSKFLHEFSSFSSEVFPSILKSTQNTCRGQWEERALGIQGLDILVGNFRSVRTVRVTVTCSYRCHSTSEIQH